jgi:hypothetical protein
MFCVGTCREVFGVKYAKTNGEEKYDVLGAVDPCEPIPDLNYK